MQNYTSKKTKTHKEKKKLEKSVANWRFETVFPYTTCELDSKQKVEQMNMSEEEYLKTIHYKSS